MFLFLTSKYVAIKLTINTATWVANPKYEAMKNIYSIVLACDIENPIFKNIKLFSVKLKFTVTKQIIGNIEYQPLQVNIEPIKPKTINIAQDICLFKLVPLRLSII